MTSAAPSRITRVDLSFRRDGRILVARVGENAGYSVSSRASSGER
jgi:hypothetical protein